MISHTEVERKTRVEKLVKEIGFHIENVRLSQTQSRVAALFESVAKLGSEAGITIERSRDLPEEGVRE